MRKEYLCVPLGRACNWYLKVTVTLSPHDLIFTVQMFKFRTIDPQIPHSLLARSLFPPPRPIYLTTMTFNTKKRTRVSENGPPASSSQTDPDSPTLEELLERNEVLERRLRKYKGLSSPSTLAILTFYYRKAEINKRYDQADYSS